MMRAEIPSDNHQGQSRFGRISLPPLSPYAVYLVLSILFCSQIFNWNDLGSHGIQGGDPALNAWVLQRVTHQLMTDPLHLLDGNAYYPIRNSLTSWDHMTSLALINLLFRMLSDNPWFGYNLLIFLAYFISAAGGYRLALTLTGSRYCAFWAGLFWGFLFFRTLHLTHLQVLSFQWMPYSAEALISFLKTEKNRHLARLVLFTLLQSLVGWYLAIINGFLLLFVLLFNFTRKNLNRSLFIRGTAAGLIILGVMLPFFLAYRDRTAVSAEGRADRISRSGEQFLPWDYIYPPNVTIPGLLLQNERYSIWGEKTLYIGFIPLLLAGFCLGEYFRRRTGSQPSNVGKLILLALSLIAIGGLFSLGYNSHTLGLHLPWYYITRLLPGLGFFRATPRFSLLLYMGVLLLSATGLRYLLERISSRRGKLVLTAMLSALFLVEVFPWRLPINPDKPFRYEETDLRIAAISREEGRTLTVLYLLPLIDSETREQPLGERLQVHFAKKEIDVRKQEVPRILLGSTLHWSNLLNGISLLIPPSPQYRLITASFPEAPAPALLRLYGVDLVVIHEIEGVIDGRMLKQMLEAGRQMGEVIDLPGGRFILRLKKGA